MEGTLTTFAGRWARAARTAVAGAVAMALSAGTALAQGLPIVRDAEIEALVRDYARPIFKAAGLPETGIQIVLVNDNSFNAFVAGRRMFINTGALLQSETPNEIIGVIAHEAGHIAGGHLERLRQQLERAQTIAILASLLGAGAVAAGAATGSSGAARAGAGIAMGAPEMVRRSLLEYQRSEEATADRSAITYLERTGQSAKGMLTTFKRFQTALSLSGTRVDPYQISHPLPRDRIANLETLAKSSKNFDRQDPPELQLRHDMMRAKIAVYTGGGQGASQRIARGGGLPARYADAHSTYLRGSPSAALAKADALIKEQPRNAYMHELRGDILMRANRPAEAAKAYQQAMQLDPSKSSIIQIAYGQALMSTGKADMVQQAVQQIEQGLRRDKENFIGYRYLAQAYGQLGDVADAELATAEGHFYSGEYQDAKIFAMRAQTKLKRGTPAWLRADDIIKYKPPGKKK